MQNFTFSSLSLLNHNMYAVSLKEDRGFGFTEERFDREKEL